MVEWLDRRIGADGPHLALCINAEEFAQAMDYLNVDVRPAWIKNKHSHATTHHFDNEDRGLCCVVCISGFEGREPIEVAGLLVHEAVHVWQAHAERIGESNPGDEQEAYAVQCISQELMAAFARRCLASQADKEASDE